MPKFLVLGQWYLRLTHLFQVEAPKDETLGDAAAIDTILGRPKVNLLDTKPKPSIGEIVFQVEDDGSMKVVAHNYDTSG